MDRDAEIPAMVAELSQRFPTLPAATVDRLVRRLFAEFDNAPIQTYVAVLVRRSAEVALQDVDQVLSRDDAEPGLRQPA